MATKSEELATKIFGLVASWRLIQRLKKVIKKVNFKPWNTLQAYLYPP